MNEEVKHTPGPWKKVPVNQTIFKGHRITLITADGDPTNYDETVVCEMEGYPPYSTGVMKANENLIAAAPEMLEALKRIYIEAKDIDACAVIYFAEKAINNAEGRS